MRRIVRRIGLVMTLMPVDLMSLMSINQIILRIHVSIEALRDRSSSRRSSSTSISV
jgi:hypothetical protein